MGAGALLASVQNFQLVTRAERSGTDAGMSRGVRGVGGVGGVGGKQHDSVVLVHGLLAETEDGVDTYSLDFSHPLSPLVAFGAVLAAQAWQ